MSSGEFDINVTDVLVLDAVMEQFELGPNGGCTVHLIPNVKASFFALSVWKRMSSGY